MTFARKKEMRCSDVGRGRQSWSRFYFYSCQPTHSNAG